MHALKNVCSRPIQSYGLSYKLYYDVRKAVARAQQAQYVGSSSVNVTMTTYMQPFHLFRGQFIKRETYTSVSLINKVHFTVVCLYMYLSNFMQLIIIWLFVLHFQYFW